MTTEEAIWNSTTVERFVLPDRVAVTMTTPFMRAYTELLVGCMAGRQRAVAIDHLMDAATVEIARSQV